MANSLLIDATPAFCLTGISIIVTFLFLWYWGTFRYPCYVSMSMVMILISTLVQLFGVLPYDITLSLDGNKPEIVAKVMNIVVRACYWTGFFMAWFIMPFFVCAFIYRYAITKARAYWLSMRYNFLWYVAASIFCTTVLLIMVFTSGFNLIRDFQPFCIAMTNAYGLTLLVFFFGHGLVELPRQLLKAANPVTRLKSLLNALNVYGEECAQATVNADCAMDGCIRLQEQLDPSLRPLINGPLEKRQRDLENQTRIQILPDRFSRMKSPEKAYAEMRRQDFTGAKVPEIENFLYLCDDCVNSLDEFGYDIEATSAEVEQAIKDVISYSNKECKAYMKRALKTGLGILVILFNTVICWGEVALMVGKQEYGPFYLLSHLNVDPLVIMLAVTTPVISYMVFVGGWSVTRMRLGKKFYRFVPHHTNENSMYYWNLAMARLGAAIVYHYILQIKAEHTETFKVYGEMKYVIFFGSDVYNRYMPIMMFVMMGLVAFHIWEKMLDLCGVQKFHFNTDEMTISEAGQGLEIVRSVRPELGGLMDHEAIRSIGGTTPLLSSYTMSTSAW